MADFSSRGPTPAGRKKPDLVGIGVTEYAERRWWIPGRGLWAGRMDGTSFASPQGAGAAALLAGSGVTDPNAQKAILIDSARQGRATPSDAMGTQTGWQPDWGWGALNLDAAFQERNNFVDAEVPGNSARFFKASGVQPTDRATLVWYRRAWTACHTGRCEPQPMTLTDLDLQQLDPNTGVVQAQSASDIDNVEQVRSPSSNATTIYKVKANTNVQGLPAEPFALAARRMLTPLQTPQPTVTLDVDATTQTPGQQAKVTATVRNPSNDLTAEDATLTLDVPPGVELTSGATTRSLGTLATNSPTQTFTWTLRGTADGVKHVTAHASATRYGETFTGSASDDYTVDGSGPEPTIVAPGGRTTSPSLNISWWANDLSDIAHYDVDLAIDGGGYAPWLTRTTYTGMAYTGSAGHTYRFRVRATDSLGNVGGYIESAPTEVYMEQPPPATTTTTPPPPKPAKKNARLTLKKAKRGRSTLSIKATVETLATGLAGAKYTYKVGHKTYTARTSTRPRHGTITLTVPLKKHARKGTLTLTYAGDSHYAPQTLRTRAIL